MKLKKYLAAFIVFVFYTAKAVQGLTEISDFGPNPGNLKMFIYKSLTALNTEPAPLVVVLHGCGQTADDISRMTGWNKLAEKNNFIVLYPQQKMANNLSLCFGWYNEHDINKGQGQCESIYQMIVYASQQFNVDKEKIFITGVSAGAAMSVVMAATHPELFNAAAIYAGGPYKLATGWADGLGEMMGKKDMSREELVSKVEAQNQFYKTFYCQMFIYHGRQDVLVNQKNALLLIDQWTGLHQTDYESDLVEEGYKGFQEIIRKEYHNAIGKPVVVYYDLMNTGHKLLIKPGGADDEGGDTGLFTKEIGFHSTYQIASDFGLVSKN